MVSMASSVSLQRLAELRNTIVFRTIKAAGLGDKKYHT